MIRKLCVKWENWIAGDDVLDEPALFVIAKVGISILVTLIVIVAPLSFLFEQAESSNPHIVLNKQDWQCAHSHTVLVGKVVEDICDTYRMRGYE